MPLRNNPFGMGNAATAQRMGSQFYWQTGYRNPAAYFQQQQKAQQQALQAGTSGLSRLVQSYNQAFQAAKSANESRYQQLLDIANQTTGQREADIRRDYASRGADIYQQLARVGLANTTMPTMQLGVEREQQSALNRLADQMQQTKLGIIERRQDEYPNANIITQLASALGQGGGSQGLGSILGVLGNLRMG